MLIDLEYLLYITDIDTGAGRDISGVDDSGSPVGETYYRKGVESRQQSVDIGDWTAALLDVGPLRCWMLDGGEGCADKDGWENMRILSLDAKVQNSRCLLVLNRIIDKRLADMERLEVINGRLRRDRRCDSSELVSRGVNTHFAIKSGVIRILCAEMQDVFFPVIG